MAELCRGAYADLNGNGSADNEDRYGYSGSGAVFIDAYWFSAGLRYVEIDKNGNPFISEDITSEKAVALVDKMQSIFHDGSNDMTTNPAGSAFANGNVLFMNHEFLQASFTLRDVNFDFGVVPIATYSEDDEFQTVTSFTYTLYGIPVDARDADMSSAVMEAMAYEGYKTVTPAVFETAMKVKYTHDEDSVRMLDIVRGSICFDFGRVFVSQLNLLTWEMFRYTIADNGNWSSTLASKLPVLEAKFEALMENFQ